MVSRWLRFTSNGRNGAPEGSEDRVRTATEDAQGSTGCSCNEPQERSLLLLYALSACLDDEALDFEAHMLGCETCFEDLKTLDRARLLVQEAMAGDPVVLERIRGAVAGYRQSLGVPGSPPQRLS